MAKKLNTPPPPPQKKNKKNTVKFLIAAACILTCVYLLQVYRTDYPLELVFSFTSSLYELLIFEKVCMLFVGLGPKVIKNHAISTEHEIYPAHIC